MRAAISMFVVLLISCDGPAASDQAVCRDYIHRLCVPALCAQVVPLFPPTASCETTLLTKSGCAAEEFTFTTPTRDRFLSCRLPLLRASESTEAHPNCEDVAESFDRCQDVVRFLQGIQ